MLYYLITCRSLTQAQRMASTLERVGLFARIIRSPRSLSSDGCGYCLKIRKTDLEKGMDALRRAGHEPKRVFAAMSDGDYMEITP